VFMCHANQTARTTLLENQAYINIVLVCKYIVHMGYWPFGLSK